MTTGPYDFVTQFAGEEQQSFFTMQSAMAHAEDIDNATGTISLNGTTLISYQDGNIEDVTATADSG